MPDLKKYKFHIQYGSSVHGQVHEIKAKTPGEAKGIFSERVKKEILSRYTFSEIVRENGEDVFKKINL